MNNRIENYRADPERLRELGIRRLQFFTSTELPGYEDGVVVAVIEGDDEACVIGFLDANEAGDEGEIDRLYLPHGHEVVRQAVPRLDFSVPRRALNADLSCSPNVPHRELVPDRERRSPGRRGDPS